MGMGEGRHIKLFNWYLAMTLRCRQWGGCMKKGAPHPVYCKLIATVTTSIDIDIPI
jgi:hypothetical protein